MKRTVIALLMALTLVLGLGGCTRDKNSGSDVPGDNPTGNSSTNNGTTNNGTNNGGTNSGNSSTDGNYGQGNDSTGSTNGKSRSSDELFRGRSYEEMLRNGRVTDTDGNLLNRENNYSK